MKKQDRPPLKARLKQGELSIGSWITLAHPAIAEIMAHGGFDWLAVDLEHSVITIREAEELIRVIDSCGITPLVRLTSNDPDLIKRVMDAGAGGIIVPMVNNAEEAKKAIRATYYPPHGQRGVGLARAQGYGVSFNEYVQSLEKDTVIVAQIEHIDAVRNLDSILSLEDIDAYIIGPYDLSASMGIPGRLNHPQLAEEIQRIKAIGSHQKKPGGLHVVEPDPQQLNRYIDDGFKFLAYSLDTRMLDRSCRGALEQIKR